MTHDIRLRDILVNEALTHIQFEFGPDALFNFLADLAAPRSNNWNLSKKYRLSVVTIIYLRQRWNILYTQIHKPMASQVEPQLTLISKKRTA